MTRAQLEQRYDVGIYRHAGMWGAWRGEMRTHHVPEGSKRIANERTLDLLGDTLRRDEASRVRDAQLLHDVEIDYTPAKRVGHRTYARYWRAWRDRNIVADSLTLAGLLDRLASAPASGAGRPDSGINRPTRGELSAFTNLAAAITDQTLDLNIEYQLWLIAREAQRLYQRCVGRPFKDDEVRR